jgi:hypothetical protein
MSLAAPLAGVSVTTAPTASAVTSAILVGDQVIQRVRLCGPLGPAGAVSSSRTPG